MTFTFWIAFIFQISLDTQKLRIVCFEILTIFIQLNFVHQVINTPIAMENIAVKRKWRKMTHWVVTMVNYAMEAKSASKVGAVRMMPITNVLTKSVETTRQVPSFMNENCYKHLYFVIII